MKVGNIVPQPAGTPGDTPQPYRDWSTHIAWRLFLAASHAKAARALLHEYEGTECDEGLTSVSYVLSQLVDDCEKIAEDVNEKEYTYEVKGAERG
jgi:hypothetical protein